MSNIDPITLSVIQAGLQQVCDEMDLTFSRSAFSPVIAEADDRSDGIYDADSGELIAQGELGLPVFVGTMQFSTMTLIEFIRDGRALPPDHPDSVIRPNPSPFLPRRRSGFIFNTALPCPLRVGREPCSPAKPEDTRPSTPGGLS